MAHTAAALMAGRRVLRACSQVKEDPPFIDVLDYVWVSDAWQVDAVPELPHRSAVAGPFPNAEQPSDHVLLSATLRLA